MEALAQHLSNIDPGSSQSLHGCPSTVHINLAASWLSKSRAPFPQAGTAVTSLDSECAPADVLWYKRHANVELTLPRS